MMAEVLFITGPGNFMLRHTVDMEFLGLIAPYLENVVTVLLSRVRVQEHYTALEAGSRVPAVLKSSFTWTTFW